MPSYTLTTTIAGSETVRWLHGPHARVRALNAARHYVPNTWASVYSADGEGGFRLANSKVECIARPVDTDTGEPHGPLTRDDAASRASDHAVRLSWAPEFTVSDLAVDLAASRNAIGVVVEVPGTFAQAVVVGVRVGAANGEDAWIVRDETGSWHELRAGHQPILGRMLDDGRIVDANDAAAGLS